jgi:peptidyl-tRNA hydrolase, PTH1 family
MAADRTMGGFVGHTKTTFGEDLVSLTLFKPSDYNELHPQAFSIDIVHSQEAFMNVSGPSVSKVLRHTVKTSSSMIVIHDSLSHKLEKISYKLGGSANGHNGVKSIISAIQGDAGFHRLRIGIGRNDVDAADFVMRKLSQHERQFWGEDGEGVDLVLGEVERIVGKTAG